VCHFRWRDYYRAADVFRKVIKARGWNLLHGIESSKTVP